MTMTIELPQAALEALSREADQRGLTPEQIVQAALLQKYAPEEQAPADALVTGADMIALWDAAGAFLPARPGDPDSPEMARQIRQRAWRRA